MLEVCRTPSCARTAAVMRSTGTAAVHRRTAWGITVQHRARARRRAHAPLTLTDHSAARTARTARCAHRGAIMLCGVVRYSQTTARRARRTPGSYSTQHGAVRYVKAPQQCAVRVQERALQSTEQLGRDRNTRGTGARSAHQHGHSALGAGQ